MLHRIRQPSAGILREATMGHCYHHALSSVRKWGGVAEDYLALHQWFDESKAITADFRHRALRHHAEGIFMLVMWTCKRDHDLAFDTGISSRPVSDWQACLIVSIRR